MGKNFNEATTPRKGKEGIPGNPSEFSDRQRLDAEETLLPPLDDHDPHTIRPGELMVFSHADGDIDANDLGFENIEVSLNDDGAIQIAAVTCLDFHWLDADEDWLDQHRSGVLEAVTQSFPGTTIDDADSLDWDNVVLRVNVTPSDPSRIPTDLDGLIKLVKANPFANLLGASIKAELPWAYLRESAVRRGN